MFKPVRDRGQFRKFFSVHEHLVIVYCCGYPIIRESCALCPISRLNMFSMHVLWSLGVLQFPVTVFHNNSISS
jgi:hypothetical protein